MSPKQPLTLEPDIRPVTLGLFPTLDSLKGVVDYADSKLPITNRNELVSILSIYHNTLLAMLAKP